MLTKYNNSGYAFSVYFIAVKALCKNVDKHCPRLLDHKHYTEFQKKLMEDELLVDNPP